MSRYHLTNEWFEGTRVIWDQLIPQINPSKVLEIGSYEGASACYLIDMMAAKSALEIHCVDSWEGGLEHMDGASAASDMGAVEKRFDANIQLACSDTAHSITVVKHKMYSDLALARLLAQGKQNYFDLVYVDGSHQAPDVLCDAVLGFRLLRAGGYMIFDDYLWSEPPPEGLDLIRRPKPAIDAFTNLYSQKLTILTAPLYQLYVQKLSD